MAKHHRDEPQKKKPLPQDEPELIADSDVVEAEEADDAEPPKKTKLPKQAPQPTKLAKAPQPTKLGRVPEPTKLAKAPQPTKLAKAPQQTQLAKKSPQPTMLAPDEPKAPDTPPKMPKMSLDDDVVEAEALDSGVVEVHPASDVVEAQPASDVVEAAEAADDEVFAADAVEEDQAAGGKGAPETPVRAEHAREEGAELITDEDAVGGENLAARAESSVRVRGKKKPGSEPTEAFDLSEKPPQELEQTVQFEDLEEDESAVDLGAKPEGKPSSSQVGVDEVAEALESGVKLEETEGTIGRAKKPVPSVEFDDFATEEGEPPSSRTRKRAAAATDGATEEVAADELMSEAAKSAEDEAAAMWKSADEADAEAGPSTPIPTKKKSALGDAEAEEAEAEEAVAEEEAEEEEEAPPRKRRPGGTAVMGRPPKPKYGRRWLGGMLVGILLAAGAVVGLRYYDPDLLEQGFGYLPEAPKQTPKADPKMVAELAQVRSELEKARTETADLLKAQEGKGAESANLKKELELAKENVKAALDLKDVLAKKMVIDDKTEWKDIPKAIGDALTSKEQAEALLQGIQKALVEAKQLAKDDKLDPDTFGKVVKDLSEKQTTVAAVNELLKGADIKDAGSKGVEQLLAAKKSIDDRLTDINKVLADEKIKGDVAKGLQEILKLRNQLAKDRDDLDQAIKAAYKELADADLAPANGDPRKQLLQGTKAARQRAESPLAIPLTQIAGTLGSLGLNPVRDVKATFENAAMLAELSYYRLREPLIQAPEQKLDGYLAMYQDRSNTDAAGQAVALKDAAWILSKEAKSSTSAQAKARAVTGLILRNQEKYEAAKQQLEQALTQIDTLPAASWTLPVKQAHKELTDPAAFYVPRVEQLQSSGQIKAATQELGVAFKVMPNEPRLLALRGHLQLEEARSNGKVAAKVQAAIRQDAAAAAKDAKAAAEAAFVLGLLEEELGDFAKAEEQFRRAIKAHQGGAEEASRYRIALARVLLRDRGPSFEPPPAEAPKKDAPAKEEKKDLKKEDKQEEKKEDKKAADAVGGVSQAFPLAAGLILAQAGSDDDEDPEAAKRLKESIELARELTNSSNPKIQGQGYMLLGQALAKQGKRTEGVREYMKGMELLFPGMASKEMAKMLEEHPAFQQPDATKAPNGYLAEVHFGKGLHLYWSRQYPQAEAHFKQAVGYFGQDARYQYFLGLAQLAQKTKLKRDAAYYSFEQGARLEAANQPPVSEINTSLERVQGDLRRLINTFRSKAVELTN